MTFSPSWCYEAGLKVVRPLGRVRTGTKVVFFVPDINFAGTNTHFGYRRKVCSLVVTAECIVLFSNNRDPKYKIHSSFGQRYRQRVQYLFLVFSNNKIQKITLSVNESPGEMIVRFGLCLSWHPKWVFYIGTLLEAIYIGTLLEAISIVLKTYFGFEFRDGSLVGDSL
jgi:hypothetical protein